MRALSTALILVASVVNLLPVGGVLSGNRLERFYAVALPDPNLVILLRHRAVLFAIVGVLLVVSAFHAPLRPAAYAAGFLSMLSFVAIAWLTDGFNAELRRVAVVDVLASAALLGALVLDYALGTRATAA